MYGTHTHTHNEVAIGPVADHWHPSGWLFQHSVQPVTETKPQNKVRTFAMFKVETQLDITC
jgi:hypothetical protein